MKQFKYTGIIYEARVTSFIEAIDIHEARQRLYQDNVYVISIEELTHQTRYLTAQKTIKEDAIIFFFQQLLLLLKGGISLSRAVGLIKKESKHKGMFVALTQIESFLYAGDSLSVSLRKSRIKMNHIYIDWIEIGEVQGKLIQALENVIKQMEEKRKLHNQLLSQLLYPSMILAFLFIVSFCVLFFVYPAMISTLSQNSDVKNPILIFLIFCKENTRLIVVGLSFGIAILCAYIFKLFRSEDGQKKIEKVILFLPICRDIYIWRFYIIFARDLGQLLLSGTQLWVGLSLLVKYQRFSPIKNKLKQCELDLLNGSSVAKSFSSLIYIPDMAKSMIVTGEETGRLPFVLLETADYYELRLKRLMSLVVKIIEPVAIIFLGVLVLLLALAVFLPLLQSYKELLN